MSITVWYSCRKHRIFPFTTREIILTLTFAAMAGALGIYSWRHLPLVDLYPFKNGTSLREDVLCTACLDKQTLLVYRDRQTGESAQFSLSDTTWYDSGRWEYVDTLTAYDEASADERTDFAVYYDGVNVADRLVDKKGTTYLLMMRNPNKLPSGCMDSVTPFLVAHPLDVVAVLPIDENNQKQQTTFDIGGRPLDAVYMERELMALLLRAESGVVVIRDGIIAGKRTCWDLHRIP